MKKINEFYFIENNKKNGPIKIEDINKYNIHQGTLVWFEGLQDWKTISKLLDEVDFGQTIPPEMPNKFEPIKTKVRHKFVNSFIAIFKTASAFILLGLFVYCISYLIISNNSNLDQGISNYKSILKAHLIEFKHPENQFCDYDQIPEYLNNSYLLNNSSEDYYSFSKNELMQEINKIIENNVDFLHTQPSKQTVLSYYKSIRCIYHNRILGISMQRAKVHNRSTAGVLSLITTIIAFLIYLIFKFTKFLIKNKN